MKSPSRSIPKASTFQKTECLFGSRWPYQQDAALYQNHVRQILRVNRGAQDVERLELSLSQIHYLQYVADDILLDGEDFSLIFDTMAVSMDIRMNNFSS